MFPLLVGTWGVRVFPSAEHGLTTLPPAPGLMEPAAGVVAAWPALAFSSNSDTEMRISGKGIFTRNFSLAPNIF